MDQNVVVKKKRKIMLAIPTCLEACTSRIASFMFTLGGLSMDPTFPWEFVSRHHSGRSIIAYSVGYNRNILVKRFLDEPDCEFLWFIDSDTLPSENSLRLLELLDKADIVGGIYPIPGGPNDPIVWGVYDYVAGKEGFLPKYLPDVGEDPVVPAGGLATGCMIIHKRVLEDPALRFSDDPTCEYPAIFRTPVRPDGKVLATDDLDFCERVQKLGRYTMLCDTSVRWGHHKSLDVTRMFDAMVKSYELGAKSVTMGQEVDNGSTANPPTLCAV